LNSLLFRKKNYRVLQSLVNLGYSDDCPFTPLILRYANDAR